MSAGLKTKKFERKLEVYIKLWKMGSTDRESGSYYELWMQSRGLSMQTHENLELRLEPKGLTVVNANLGDWEGYERNLDEVTYVVLTDKLRTWMQK